MGDGDRMSERLPDRGEPSAAFSGRGTGWNDLAEKLGALSRQLQKENDVEATLDAVVRAATDTVPGAEHASISVVIKRREVRTRASTGELPRAVDQAQYDTGQGPCLDTLFESRTVRFGDLDAETRWPDFTARTRALGLRSMLSIQLYVAGDDLGALNLHSTRPDAFGDESEQVGLLFASHAAIAFADAQELEHLRIAVSSRDLIGQAKGILMERYKINADQSFRLLVVASQTTNVRLLTLADHLTQTGQLVTHGS